jgi:hypothetical protein
MPKLITTQRYIDSLKFYMMPQDGGQMVEVRYACDCDGIWQWKYDRSDRTSAYSFAKYNARATEEQLAFEAQNSRLPKHNRWQDVVVQPNTRWKNEEERLLERAEYDI